MNHHPQADNLASMDDSDPGPHTTEQQLSSWEEFQRYAAGFEDPTR